MLTEPFVIGKYLRLSLEDEKAGESESISNQRMLIDSFIQDDSELRNCRVIEFIDDGKTGTNYDRPGYQELFRNIRQGNVNCVIVKDFSRMGRDYVETGNLIEQVFPFLGTRFISVNDHFDSQKICNQAGDPNFALKNLANYLYSLELSDKVTKSKKALMKRGEYIASYAFFGYKKSKEDKRQLVIDEGAAEIVRRIYQLFLDKMTCKAIALLFNKEGVPTPMQYKAATRQKHNTHWEGVGTGAFWVSSAIGKILRDERYTGKYIAGKTEKLVLGSAKRRAVPKENWITADNIYEPIISVETFLEAQKLLKKEGNKGNCNKSPLARKVKCAFCCRTLHKKHNKYFCYSPSYIENENTSKCVKVRIRVDALEKLVLDAINAVILTYAECDQDQSEEQRIESIESLQKQVCQKELELQKVKTQGLTLYEQYKKGGITKEKFLEAKKRNAKKIDTLTSDISKIKARIVEMEEEEANQHFGQERVQKYRGYTELTKAMVDDLISQIIIQDENHIEIVWNFRRPEKGDA